MGHHRRRDVYQQAESILSPQQSPEKFAVRCSPIHLKARVMCAIMYHRRRCTEPLWVAAAAFVMPKGDAGNAEESTETLQASRLSETDRGCVLRRTQALAPRPTVCRQAWIRQQVAAAEQSVPAKASAMREVYGTGTVHNSNCGRPYHSASW